VKKGVNPDFSKKAEHKEIGISIPTKCVMNWTLRSYRANGIELLQT
jgi:hypothetical protein